VSRLIEGYRSRRVVPLLGHYLPEVSNHLDLAPWTVFDDLPRFCRYHLGWRMTRMSCLNSMHGYVLDLHLYGYQDLIYFQV
jgi:hypothetical protein